MLSYCHSYGLGKAYIYFQMWKDKLQNVVVELYHRSPIPTPPPTHHLLCSSTLRTKRELRLSNNGFEQKQNKSDLKGETILREMFLKYSKRKHSLCCLPHCFRLSVKNQVGRIFSLLLISWMMNILWFLDSIYWCFPLVQVRMLNTVLRVKCLPFSQLCGFLRGFGTTLKHDWQCLFSGNYLSF